MVGAVPAPDLGEQIYSPCTDQFFFLKEVRRREKLGSS